MSLLKVEHSIYLAYLELIQRAEKFIYIENQFFVTSCLATEEYADSDY